MQSVSLGPAITPGRARRPSGPLHVTHACARAPGGPLCPTEAERVRGGGRSLPRTPVPTAVASEAGARCPHAPARLVPPFWTARAHRRGSLPAFPTVSGDWLPGTWGPDLLLGLGSQRGGGRGPFWWGTMHCTRWASFSSPEGHQAWEMLLGRGPPFFRRTQLGSLGALKPGWAQAPGRGARRRVQPRRTWAGRRGPVCPAAGGRQLASSVPASRPRSPAARPCLQLQPGPRLGRGPHPECPCTAVVISNRGRKRTTWDPRARRHTHSSWMTGFLCRAQCPPGPSAHEPGARDWPHLVTGVDLAPPPRPGLAGTAVPAA